MASLTNQSAEVGAYVSRSHPIFGPECHRPIRGRQQALREIASA